MENEEYTNNKLLKSGEESKQLLKQVLEEVKKENEDSEIVKQALTSLLQLEQILCSLAYGLENERYVTSCDKEVTAVIKCITTISKVLNELEKENAELKKKLEMYSSK